MHTYCTHVRKYVSMPVSMCATQYVCMYVCTCACVHVFVHVCMYDIRVCMYLCMHACMYAVYACMYLCVYSYTCIYMSVYVLFSRLKFELFSHLSHHTYPLVSSWNRWLMDFTRVWSGKEGVPGFAGLERAKRYAARYRSSMGCSRPGDRPTYC